MDIPETEEDYGPDLDDELYADYEGRLVLVADEVSPASRHSRDSWVARSACPGRLASCCWCVRVRVPMLFLGLCAVSVLVATWAAVWRWYPAVPFLDEAVHVVAPVLWEYDEWLLEQVSPRGLIVTYTDTVGDLLTGTTGAAAARLLVLWWGGKNRC